MSHKEILLGICTFLFIGCSQNHFAKEAPVSQNAKAQCEVDADCPPTTTTTLNTTTTTLGTTTTTQIANNPQFAISVRNGAGQNVPNGGDTCTDPDLPEAYTREVSLYLAASGIPRADKFWCRRKTAPADSYFRDCTKANIYELLFVGDSGSFVRQSDLSARIDGYSGLTNRVYEFEAYAETTSTAVPNKVTPVKSFRFEVKDCGLNCPANITVDLAYTPACTISPCMPGPSTLRATVTGDTQGRMLNYHFFECDNPSNVFGDINTTQKTATLTVQDGSLPGPHCVIVRSSAPAGTCPAIYGEAQD